MLESLDGIRSCGGVLVACAPSLGCQPAESFLRFAYAERARRSFSFFARGILAALDLLARSRSLFLVYPAGFCIVMDYLGRGGGGHHRRGLPGWAGRHGSCGLSCRELCARGRVCSSVVYVAYHGRTFFLVSFFVLRFRVRFLGGFGQSARRYY